MKWGRVKAVPFNGQASGEGAPSWDGCSAFIAGGANSRLSISGPVTAKRTAAATHAQQDGGVVSHRNHGSTESFSPAWRVYNPFQQQYEYDQRRDDRRGMSRENMHRLLQRLQVPVRDGRELAELVQLR